MFSSRLRHGAAPNRLALTLDARRTAGHPIFDLTLSNPTRAGFVYPPDLLAPLAAAEALTYNPSPFGLDCARKAVSDDFARRGWAVPPERIMLTASTSEAYSLLFKLLCDPGDVVMTPRPSYPLIEHLTDLDAVTPEFYSLEWHGKWTIDLARLREAIESANDSRRRIRALVSVSPNNPTGSVVERDEAYAMAELACAHDVALIVDEVFADYPLCSDSAAAIRPTAAWTSEQALTFTLGGLSKTVGLPQVKLGWIGVTGPAHLVAEAMERLETIGDAYLSASTPVQLAAPDLLRKGASVRDQIQIRVRRNWRHLARLVEARPSCSLLPSDAGWSAVVRVPSVKPEEELVVDILDRTGILVHPGYFFDFEREAFLVFSLLPEEAMFVPSVERVLDEAGRA